MLLFAFWAFNKKTLSLHPGQSRKMTNLTLQQKYLLNNPNKKKQQQVVDGEAIAAAVLSLVPSKEEQEERILLLREEKLIKKSQEKRDYQSLKHSEYEKFFSNDLALPPAIKEQLQEKMSKLAQDFLSNKF